jgi:hypothetical protein
MNNRRAGQARNTVAISLILLLAALSACAPATKIPLANALSDHQIGVTLQSRGTYGDIVVATMTSTSDQAIEVTITPGTLLRNETRSGESLVLVRYKGKLATPTSDMYQENAQLTLGRKGDQHIALLEAYSVNALADPAQISDTFALSGTANTNVLAVVKALKDGDAIEAKQMAVWAVTDNITAKDLDNVQFKYSPAHLTAARDILARADLTPNKFKLFANP